MADLSLHATAAQRGMLLSDVQRRRRLLMPALGPGERLKVIDTLAPLLEGVYCHLPQKRAAYAVDPVQALRLLRQQCVELTDGEFHLAVTGIITGLRDAHTRYVGPSGMRGRVATLPFLVESYEPYAAPRFIVSKLAQTADVEDPDFAEGVELVSWNFVPMSRAVDVYSSQETGGRPDARRARALETLTFRSLDYGPPPDEHSVIVGFTVGQTLHEVRIPWRVVGIPPATMAKDPQVALKAGWDPAAESVRKAKKLMFAPAAWDAQRLKDAKREAPQRKTPAPAPDSAPAAPPVVGSVAAVGDWIATSLPDVLSARTVPTKRGDVGYLRIWSFDVDDHEAFVTEVSRLLKELPQDRLIVDLRANPGGLIWAAERSLQLFADETILPTRFSLLATPVTRAMAESAFNRLELGAWVESLNDAVSTGEVYSQPKALTDPAFRRALNWGIDKQRINDFAYNGLANLGTSIIQSDYYHDPDWHWEPPADVKYGFDLEKCKQLLDAAGYKDVNGDGLREDKAGKPMTLRLWARSESMASQTTGKLIAGWFKQVGLKINFQVMDSGAMSDAIYNFQGPDYAPDFDMFLWGWGGGIDPNFILSVFTSDQAGSWSDCGYSNPEYDRLDAQQASTIDKAQRKQLLDHMQQILYEDSPYIVLVYSHNTEAYNTSRWDGWVRSPKGGGVWYTADNIDSYLQLHPKTAATDDGSSSTAWIAAIVVILVAVVLVIVLLVRRARGKVVETE